MKKTLIFIVLTLFWTVLLFPKNVLWNNFTQNMSNKNIIIIAKQQEDKRYKFTANNTKVYFNSIKIANIGQIETRLWLFYNEIELKNLRLSKNMPILKNLKILNSHITYTLLSPTKVKIKGKSKIGDFIGEVEIFKHKGFILLKSNTMRDTFLQQYFKKTKEGMRYEFAY